MSDIKVIKSVDELLDSKFKEHTIHLPLNPPNKLEVDSKKGKTTIPFSIQYRIFGKNIFKEENLKNYLGALPNVLDINLEYDQLFSFLDKNVKNNDITFYGLEAEKLLGYDSLLAESYNLKFESLNQKFNYTLKEDAARGMVTNLKINYKKQNIVYGNNTIEHLINIEGLKSKFNAQDL